MKAIEISMRLNLFKITGRYENLTDSLIANCSRTCPEKFVFNPFNYLKFSPSTHLKLFGWQF